MLRTQDEIRSTMHLTLKGDETGLVSYYQFNTDDAAGTAGGVKDAFSGNDGTTANMTTADYIPSEVAVAGGVSQMIDVTAAGTVNFDEPEVSIDFGASNPNGNVWVYRLETEKPHGWDMTPGGFDFDNEYFVVQNFGTNPTFDVLSDITFGRLNYIDPSVNPTDVEVYKRESNEFGDWTGRSQGGANAIQGGSAGACEYNTANGINSFSQFVLVNKSTSNTDLPIELLSFEAERKNLEEVRLDWATATEIDNKGFEVERMLDTEIEFTKVAFVEGYGNSNQQINYGLLDDNAHNGISYYRLKQIDFDGTYEYSEIRAVTGEELNADIKINIYPNPTERGINIHFAEVSPIVQSAEVRILDVHGRLVYDATVGISQNQILEIEETENFPSGVYMVQIIMDDFSKHVQRIVRK